MYWGFKKIPFTLYTYVLAEILLNGAKFIPKLTPAFKNHIRNLNKFRHAVKSPKFNGIFSKIYIPSAKALYTEDLSNITLNHLYENSPNYLCHFWNHKSFFATTHLYLFSSNVTFLKKYPIKVQTFRLSTAQVKVQQIPHVIFQIKSHFSSRFWIFLQCHERKFFCTFLAETLYATDKSSTWKCKFSDFPLLSLKFNKFLMLFFK